MTPGDDSLEWIINDEINALTPSNLGRVRAELVHPNVVFGLHRVHWGSPVRIAFSTEEAWDAELHDAAPGANLMLISLARVEDQSILHVGTATSLATPVPSAGQQSMLHAILKIGCEELSVVHRYVADDQAVHCGHTALWDDEEAWADRTSKWSQLSGELFFFDAFKVVWQAASSATQAALPPDQWSAQHGDFLLDAYVPDAEGRVSFGGSYCSVAPIERDYARPAKTTSASTTRLRCRPRSVTR